ncbi:hypothetical protein [Flavobacterium branchiicola]|uniref:DUF1360 domain-containing protein n=1 Tax=Flavobacterium branchiicola TaxID=1114875 RepID=A0ABV9PBE1_9FLAO|nr:hypothetical protein [Flavobacterium branchiicola]MBS7254221.1 hypothetical protein [Flavobacterium branchiicola]
MEIGTQIIWLVLLAIPIACISWTVTHEEIFKEPREWCVKHSQNDRFLLSRKAFYLFTCEYCFSHYVTIAVLLLSDYKLLLNDWKGYILAGFSLVFMANIYMSLFALLRQAIKKEKVEIEKIENETDSEKLSS